MAVSGHGWRGRRSYGRIDPVHDHGHRAHGAFQSMASIPLARDALTDPVTIGIAVVSLVLLLTTELDTLWIILGAAVISLSASSLGLIGRIPLR